MIGRWDCRMEVMRIDYDRTVGIPEVLRITDRILYVGLIAGYGYALVYLPTASTADCRPDRIGGKIGE